MDAEYTEWCPDCGEETSYSVQQPFKCSGCDRILFPCDACLQEHGVDGVTCQTCPWELDKPEMATGGES